MKTIEKLRAVVSRVFFWLGGAFSLREAASDATKGGGASADGTIAMESLAQKIGDLAAKNDALAKTVHELYTLSALKFIAPKWLDLLTINLFDPTPETKRVLTVTWMQSPVISSIRNKLSLELTRINDGIKTSDIPYREQIDLYKNLIAYDTPHKPYIYNHLVFYKMFHGQADDELLDIFCQGEKEFNAWNTQRPDFWLSYISFLELKGDFENSARVMKKYVERHGMERLASILPVAKVAFECGFSNDMIKRAARIFELFKNNENSRFFQNYLKNKRIAVVGGGPQEIGTGNGNLIDSSDVVIRFNELKLSPNVSVDYGKKTSVSSKNVHTAKVIERADIEVLFFMEDIYAFALGAETIQAFEYYHKKNIPLVYHTTQERYDVELDMDIKMPTSGLRMLHLVKKHVPEFSAENCFGFAFKSKTGSEEDLYMHYYEEEGANTKNSAWEDIVKEGSMIRQRLFPQ